MKTNKRTEILKDCSYLRDCLNKEMNKIIPQSYDTVIRTEEEHPEWCAVNRRNYEIARNSYHYFTEIAEHAQEMQHNKKYVEIITDAKDILGQGLMKTNKMVLLGEFMNLIKDVEVDFGFFIDIDGLQQYK